MNGKTGFAVATVIILVAASMVPVVGSHQKSMSANRDEPSVVEEETYTDTKMVEVPVQIHTLDGVKKITRQLPIGEVKTLSSLFNRTRRAVKTLQASQASSIQKQRADEVIDTFLSKLKEHGLLGDMSIQRVRELIIGESIKQLGSDRDTREMALMANLLRQRGWAVNAMCFFVSVGGIADFHPWNCIPMLLQYGQKYVSSLPSLLEMMAMLAVAYFMVLNSIPHPTTLGLWIVEPWGFFPGASEAYLHTLGLFGSKRIRTKEPVTAFTLGFTGIVVLQIASIGFTIFTAAKEM